MRNRLPLKDRAQGRWSGILPALGIGESFLTGKHGPCPLCGGKDRWRWDNLEGRGTWICSRCGAGDGIALVMKRNGWEFREAAVQIESLLGSSPADAPKRERSDGEKRDAMNRLWRLSKPVVSGDPVARYLARRVGLTRFPDCLRTAYSLRYRSDCPSLHPAMIAMATTPDGAPSILHRTYLTYDGRKAPVTEPRLWMPGTIAKGAAIRLAPAKRLESEGYAVEVQIPAEVGTDWNNVHLLQLAQTVSRPQKSTGVGA